MNFLMHIIASGVARGRVRTTTRTKVAQQGGHTGANRLTETSRLGLQRKSLTLDMHVMAN